MLTICLLTEMFIGENANSSLVKTQYEE